MVLERFGVRPFTGSCLTCLWLVAQRIGTEGFTADAPRV